MGFIKRIFLFILINLLVVLTVTFLMSLFHVQPYLSAYGLNITHLAIFCLIWGFAGAFISLMLSKHLAKWMMGVKIVDDSATDTNSRFILEKVKEISLNAGLFHTPEVGIYKSNEVNAFATGPTQKKSLIALSTGLLNKMDQDEIEAIIGHEISHIKNGDMVTMTLLQGVVNAFVMFLARILAFAISSRGRERNRSSYTSMRMFTFLFEIVFMIFGSIILATYSRKREFKADIGSAKILGKEKMIKALSSLKSAHGIRDPKTAVAAFQNFKISNPSKKGFVKLFLSHPPLDERIENLRNL